MYRKLKYIILICLLIGLGLSIFNYIKLLEYGSFYSFRIPIVLCCLLVVFFFLPRKLKDEKNIVTIIALGIGLIFITVSASTTIDYFESERRTKIFAEYSQLDCSEMEKKFSTDLKNNTLKYFSSGLFYNESLGENLQKNGIEEFHQGCIITVNFDCYREMLSEYLDKEKNIRLEDLYDKN